MRLKEAIKLLKELRDGCGSEMQNYIDACNLGIEALEEIRHLHEIQVLQGDELLLGETLTK